MRPATAGVITYMTVSMGTNRRTKLLKRVAAASAVVTVLVMGYHAFFRPLEPREVAQRAIGCFERNDMGCIVGLATDEEKASLSLGQENLSKAQSQLDTAFLAGAVRSAPPIIQETRDGCSASAVFDTPSGLRFSVTYVVGIFDGGARLRSASADTIVGPLVSLHRPNRPSVGGPDKIARLYQIAQYGKNYLAPLGLAGWANWAEDGFHSNTWDGIMAKDKDVLAGWRREVPPALSLANL